jgi:transposase
MLLCIAIVGGLRLMMGQHTRSESLFYYFRLEDQVPGDHLLRLIDKHVDFGFVRERLKESYSDTGRPSIDPELLLRILLIGYRYGISSERKLVEELRMHLAWRWFTGLGFDQEVPHHSTFSKNRHGRFQESKLFEQLFERIVATWLIWKCRIQSSSRPIVKTRCPLPIRIPPMRPKVARQRAWGTTTITWWITTAASSWACKRQALA